MAVLLFSSLSWISFWRTSQMFGLDGFVFHFYFTINFESLGSSLKVILFSITDAGEAEEVVLAALAMFLFFCFMLSFTPVL